MRSAHDNCVAAVVMTAAFVCLELPSEDLPAITTDIVAACVVIDASSFAPVCVIVNVIGNGVSLLLLASRQLLLLPTYLHCSASCNATRVLVATA